MRFSVQRWLIVVVGLIVLAACGSGNTASSQPTITPPATTESRLPSRPTAAPADPAATTAPTPSQAPVISLPNTGGSSSTPLLWVGLGLGLFLVGVAQLRRSRRAQA